MPAPHAATAISFPQWPWKARKRAVGPHTPNAPTVGTSESNNAPLFGGRDVTCGFTGFYSPDTAQVSGTALVGKTSVMFVARLMLRSKL